MRRSWRVSWRGAEHAETGRQLSHRPWPMRDVTLDRQIHSESTRSSEPGHEVHQGIRREAESKGHSHQRPAGRLPKSERTSREVHSDDQIRVSFQVHSLRPPALGSHRQPVGRLLQHAPVAYGSRALATNPRPSRRSPETRPRPDHHPALLRRAGEIVQAEGGLGSVLTPTSCQSSS